MLLDASVPRHVSAHITACFCQAFVFVRPVSSVSYYYYYYLLLFLFIFHSVRQPYSETSCSCVLVDGSIVWTVNHQSQKKRQMKGTTRAINCTLFSFLKCERILFQGLSEQTNIDIEYVVYILFTFAGFLCFLPLCLGSCLTRFLDILVSFTSC